MPDATVAREERVKQVLLGDEAVAQAALDAGITAAYAYPGTPSTEILEYLVQHEKRHGGPKAVWSANEKTAYEQALGVCMLGRRSLVAMKHVGLNVAADPFVNSALVDVRGGLVVAVADDPGMHSSQNEQDTRIFADFAKVLCLEPSNQQEAYEMTREAYELSERFHIPVVVRLVTRLCHSRAAVVPREAQPEKPLSKDVQPASWILLPVNARRLWREHLDLQPELQAWSEACAWNRYEPSEVPGGLGIITTGVARNYYLENLDELEKRPSHLHIGAYPVPAEKVRELAAHVDRILVLEEGQPWVERSLRGFLPPPLPIHGKLDGALPLDGELTPDNVRRALGLGDHERMTLPGFTLPPRPPQLCQGCPHRDAFASLNAALEGLDASVVMSDIGCYTLGALPPYQSIESCVCMGASIGMAKGAADAGMRPALAVIGDSTFLHSGVTPLMDAVSDNTPMTLLILDNGTVGMTGQQPTVLSSSRLEPVVRGLGVDPEHLHVTELHPKREAEVTALIRREIAYEGLSVIIGIRECIQSARKSKSHS
jgi:indolepyruvate ferredoxin oxidoreductase alpha subunit